MKRRLTVEKISGSAKVSLYSICFEPDGTTEFERFVNEFEHYAEQTGLV